MTRLLAVCLIAASIGCQYQPRSPVYDPFAAASQRIPPPATGALNQGYYQAPTYQQQQPTYQQPTYQQAPAYQQPVYPPAPAYQVPQMTVPQLQQPQIPPGFVPATTSVPANLTPVSRTARVSQGSFAQSTSSNVPTPKATANWPPRRSIRSSSDLDWGPGVIRQVSAEQSVAFADSSPTLTAVPQQQAFVQPTTYWAAECQNCDPYATPHVANPLLPIPAAYENSYPVQSGVTYSANQTYSGDQWRRRSRR